MSGFKINDFSFGGGGGALELLTATNTCLDDMEEFKGRNVAIS